MKYFFYPLFLILSSCPALAQEPLPSAQLTPFEDTRYGQSLWEVPREPFQSRYRQDRDLAGLPSGPLAEPPPARRNQGFLGQSKREAQKNLKDQKVRQRFQSQMQWEKEQRKISERSRFQPPAPKQP